MKKICFTIFVAAVLPAIYSCKKESAPASATQWTFRDTTYLAYQTLYSNQTFEGVNSTGNSIALTFNKTPITTGVYTVSKALSANTDCEIAVNDINNIVYYSSGKVGDTVVVSFSGSKLTASFDNIQVSPLANSVEAQFVSGTIVQQ